VGTGKRSEDLLTKPKRHFFFLANYGAEGLIIEVERNFVSENEVEFFSPPSDLRL
jgi:hypothetical protein